jgi:hypothetical protein
MSNGLNLKVMKNVMDKVIVVMIMMAIAYAMPAMADNGKYVNSGRRDHAVVVNNHRNPAGHDIHKKPAYRPDIKTCIVKVSRHTPHNRVVAKAKRVRGVMDTKWDPRTRELTVIYDGKVTSARNIKHFMA